MEGAVTVLKSFISLISLVLNGSQSGLPFTPDQCLPCVGRARQVLPDWLTDQSTCRYILSEQLDSQLDSNQSDSSVDSSLGGSSVFRQL